MADQILKLDNVRESSMTLDELLGGRVVVELFGQVEDVPAVLLALPMVEQPPAA